MLIGGIGMSLKCLIINERKEREREAGAISDESGSLAPANFY